MNDDIWNGLDYFSKDGVLEIRDLEILIDEDISPTVLTTYSNIYSIALRILHKQIHMKTYKA